MQQPYDDELMAQANAALNTLVSAAANRNMHDSVAMERARLEKLWKDHPDLNPVYIGERICYSPSMILVSLQFQDDGITPIFIIGPVNNGLAFTDMQTISKMRGEYIFEFRCNIASIEKYDAAIDYLTNELKLGPDQIYVDIPESTLYRKMMEAGRAWNRENQIWY